MIIVKYIKFQYDEIFIEKFYRFVQNKIKEIKKKTYSLFKICIWINFSIYFDILKY